MLRTGSITRRHATTARNSLAAGMTAPSVASGEEPESHAPSSSTGAAAALFGLGEFARLFQETVFGVVAVMSKGAQKKLRWALLETAVISVQYVLFPLQLFSWDGIAWAEAARRVLRLAIPFRLSTFPFHYYLVVFWCAVGAVALSLATAFYVGYAFANQDFRFMWPLKLLRFVVSNLVGVLYMPLISVFSSIFNCPLPGSADPRHLYFPDSLTCWNGTHATLTVIAAVAVLSFTLFAASAQLLFFETDYYKRGPEGEREYFSRPHSRVDAFFFVNNVALSILINLEAVPLTITSLLFTASGLSYGLLLLEFYPYHRLACNTLYTGLAAAFTYASGCCLVDNLFPSGSTVGLEAALLGGIVPAFGLGAAASWARYRLRMCTGDVRVLERIRRPLHVEIAARFVYEAGPDDEEAAAVAEGIYRAGVAKFPSSAAVLLAYAQFCYTFRRSPELGHERVWQAGKLNPGFDLRFVIYRREIERQQSAHASDLGDAKRDLIAHIEFTSNLAGARKFHRVASRALRKFWSQLAAAEGELDLRALEGTLALMDAAERRAHAHYRALLGRYPRAARILRAYGRFQMEVLNDEQAAQSLFEQADSYEDERLLAAPAAAASEAGSPRGPGARSPGGSAAVSRTTSLARAGSGLVSPPRSVPQLVWQGPKRKTLADRALDLLTRRARRTDAYAPEERGRDREAPEGGAAPASTSPPPARGGRPASLASLKRPPVVLSTAPPPVLGRKAPGQGAPRSASRLPSLGPQPAYGLFPPQARPAASGSEGEAARPSSPVAKRPVPLDGAWADPQARSASIASVTWEPVLPAKASLVSPSGSPVPHRLSLAGTSSPLNSTTANGGSPPRRPAHAPRSALSVAGGDEWEAPPRISSSPALLSSSPDRNPRLSSGSQEDGMPYFLIPPPASSAPKNSKPRSRSAWSRDGEEEGNSRGEKADGSPKGSSAGSLELEPQRKKEGEEAGIGALARLLPPHDPALELGSGSKNAAAARDDAGSKSPTRSVPVLDVDANDGEEDPEGEEGGGQAGSRADADRRRRVRRWLKVKRRIQSASHAHAASLRRMKHVVAAVLLAVAALAFTSFFVVDNLVREYEDGIVLAGDSGGRRKNSALVALHAQSLGLAGLPLWDPAGALEAAARAALQKAADELESLQISVFARGARLPQDTTPSTALRILSNDQGTIADVKIPLWDAGLQLVSNARRVARAPLAAVQNGTRETFFVRENAPRLYNAFVEASSMVDQIAYTGFVKIRQFLIAMFASVTGLLLLLALAFFRPTVASVQHEKAHALGLFRDIPRASARRLARRQRRDPNPSSAHIESEAGTDDEDNFDDLDAEEAALTARGGRRGSASGGEKGGTSASGGRFQRLRAAFRRLVRVDRVTMQYGGAFLLLWSLFLVWFAVGLEAAATCETFSTERNFAGLMRSLPVRAHFHAREMAKGATDYESQRASLVWALDKLVHVHRALLFGNQTEHVNGAIHRYPPTDKILFGKTCLLPLPDGGCVVGGNEGLEALLIRFVEEARIITELPVVGPESDHIRFMESAIKGGMQTWLQNFADLFVEEAKGKLGAFLSLQSAMFGGVVALLVLEYLLVFRRIVSGLTDESRRTVFMFLMLPPDVIEATGSIKAHLYRLLAADPAAS